MSAKAEALDTGHLIHIPLVKVGFKIRATFNSFNSIVKNSI